MSPGYYYRDEEETEKSGQNGNVYTLRRLHHPSKGGTYGRWSIRYQDDEASGDPTCFWGIYYVPHSEDSEEERRLIHRNRFASQQYTGTRPERCHSVSAHMPIHRH